MGHISNLSGDSFDCEFAKEMVADHKKDIKEFEKAAKKDDAAGAFVKETLPTLQKHLQTAQSLSGSAAETGPSTAIFVSDRRALSVA